LLNNISSYFQDTGP